MKVIRVVVGEVPRILREIIEGAVKIHPDIQVLRSDDANLSGTAAKCRADAAVVALASDTSASHHRSVLVDNPNLKIFVLTDGGRAAHMLELRRTPLVDVSPSGLTDAIKTAVGREDSDDRQESA